jgi:hypothetical protein
MVSLSSVPRVQVHRGEGERSSPDSGDLVATLDHAPRRLAMLQVQRDQQDAQQLLAAARR